MQFTSFLRYIGGYVYLVRPRADGKGYYPSVSHAVIQHRRAIFLTETPVSPGMIIEHPIHSGVTRRYEVTRVAIRHPEQGVEYIEADFKIAGAPDRVTAQPLRLPWLHPLISAASAALFEDGYINRAVFAAFQAIEHRIQELTGRSDSGKKLMMTVFDDTSPNLNVARFDGRNGQDEQEGFKFIYAGAVLALRNPRGHGAEMSDDPAEGMEYLALASLLMRRLDDAEEKLPGRS